MVTLQNDLQGKWNNRILLLMGMIFPLVILGYKGISIGVAVLAICEIVSLREIKKIYIDRCFLAMWILSVITLIVCVASELGRYWLQTAVYNFVVFSLLCLFVFFEFVEINQNKIKIIVYGLKAACIIQILWSYMQFFFFKVYKIDINDQLFNELLHMRKIASTYAGETLCVSGLGWHASLLVPVIILSYCLFHRSLLMKLLLCGVAVISTNSTCIFALLICIALDVVFFMIQEKKVGSKIGIHLALIIVLCAVIVLFREKIFTEVNASVSKLFGRMTEVLNGSPTTNSTKVHSRYYSYYGEVFKYSGVIKNLFGYGYDCSGYPYTKLLNQFAEMKAWNPESDIINFVVGRGWIWTIIYYVYLFYIAIKGMKISKYYFAFIVTLMVSGILYNNQFGWVMFVEVICYIAIKKNINIWKLEEKE